MLVPRSPVIALCWGGAENLTTEMVWAFMAEGCNAREIAAYGHISEAAAIAWMSNAARTFAKAA